jgi:ribulose-phosphate 3-epimerase
MSVIVPAILPKNRAELDDKLYKLHGLVDSVQIDVVDGRFANPTSWPYCETKDRVPARSDDTLPYLGEIAYDMDLMVEEPEKVLGHWVQAGANRITVHAESSHRLPQIIEDFKTKYGYDKDFAPDLLSFGLAISTTTDLSLIEPYLAHCDYVQFMGIADIGKQGQPFDKRVLAKISEFRKKHDDLLIQVDGGVSLETAPALLAAGVSRLVIGSALWKSDNLRQELKKFQAIAHSYGMYE